MVRPSGFFFSSLLQGLATRQGRPRFRAPETAILNPTKSSQPCLFFFSERRRRRPVQVGPLPWKKAWQARINSFLRSPIRPGLAGSPLIGSNSCRKERALCRVHSNALFCSDRYRHSRVIGCSYKRARAQGKFDPGTTTHHSCCMEHVIPARPDFRNVSGQRTRPPHTRATHRHTQTHGLSRPNPI
ncbi:hypothetical protein B0H63DRAFT_475765 [Podospora didyma]|uniref:Uncharacterized protein n=1 Tax=Podospora didyma TaxID=330526 RepID=A0AAE0TW11_9PEZI|nr:hypothetical protein B0H63DRAFT_475765 [Podospora didyma]